MPLPKQTTDFTSDRVASAPYNFVPLPEEVVTAAERPDALPPHDRYDPERLSGYFDVRLTARSPLYVRGALPLEDFLQREQGMSVDDLETPGATFRDLPENTPAFFYQSDPESPVIPGSSLRGMLRFYLSIASYGKLGPVSDRRVFYRSLDTQTRVGTKYASQVVHGDTKTGFLQERGGRYVIQPCECAKVPAHVVSSADQDGTPSWEGHPYRQHQTVGVERQGDTWRIDPKVKKGMRPGCLAVSGWMFNKEREHVFLFPQSLDEGALVEVEDDLVRDFNSDEQITAFQRRAYPADQPLEGARKRDGLLRTDLTPKPNKGYFGEPVHYLPTGDGDGGERAVFFGRAKLFRLLYERSPRETLPKAHGDTSIYDYAEALFGFVRTGDVRADFLDREGTTEEGWEEIASCYEQGGRGRAYAGRVRVTPAAAAPGQGDVRAGRALVPRVLSTPEPTTVQHYLVQTSDAASDIKTYDDAGGYRAGGAGHASGDGASSGSAPETTLRGHKLYWHQGEVSLRDIEAPDADALDSGDSQHTFIRPVMPRARFRFRVHFDNLSEAELGALSWALRPQGDPDVMHPGGAAADGSNGTPPTLPKRGYFHKLGMGRPLGMGSAQLDAALHLTDRRERYRALFDEGAERGGGCRWHGATHPASEEERAAFRAAFERDVREQLTRTGGGWTGGEDASLREQPRVQDLLALMRWPGHPAKAPTPSDPKRYLRAEHRPNTRYMQIELDGHGDKKNEYRDRPVLPPPATFDGRAPITEQRGFDERQRGTVKWFNREKGYGFIVPEAGCVFPEGGGDVFVHQSDLDGQDLPDGQAVTYDVEKEPKGLQAYDVALVG